jgi:acetolactate synthase-1/2/3 large subunit
MWAAQRSADPPGEVDHLGRCGHDGFWPAVGDGGAIRLSRKKVLAIAGDGGFQMTLVELATIRRCNLPLKILVMDNKYLGMVRQWQELFFDNRYSGVDLSDNPDFAALARVYGLEAFHAERREPMGKTLSAWWNT